MKIPALLLAVLALLGLGLRHAASQGADSAPIVPATVFVVRHAEKDVSAPRDPDPALTAEGEARAAALARLLGQAGVTHLVATQFTRTRATLAPLAKATGIDVTTIPAGEGGRLLAVLRTLPSGAVAVVAGHSNTVPRIVEGLGGEVRELVDAPPYGEILADDQYDRLFCVTLPTTPDAAVKTVELRYGD